MIIGSGWTSRDLDEESLATPTRRWHASAPAKLRRTTGPQGWQCWQAHLAHRSRPLPLGQLLRAYCRTITATSDGPAKLNGRQFPGPALRTYPGTTTVSSGGPAALNCRQVPGPALIPFGDPLSWAAQPLAQNRSASQELGLFVTQATPRRVTQRLEKWLAQLPDAIPNAVCALEVLAWAHALPQLAAVLPEPRWWQLLAGFLAAARVASQIDLHERPLAHQLLAAELPLTLAYLFPEIQTCRTAAGPGQSAVTHGLLELLHGDGLPHAAQLDLLFPLLACWTRCLALKTHSEPATTRSTGRNGTRRAAAARSASAPDDRAPLAARPMRQYRLLLRNALRLVRPDGTCGLDGRDSRTQNRHSQAAQPRSTELWTGFGTGSETFDWLHAAAQLSGSPWEPKIAAIVLGPCRPKAQPRSKTRSRRAVNVETPSSTCSEAAAVAILRSDWSANSRQVTVAWHQEAVPAPSQPRRATQRPGSIDRFGDRLHDSMQIEIRHARQVFCHGPWTLEATIDGRPARLASRWEEVCWVSDEDVDYLELQASLEGGYRVQRHLLLARDDGFLWLGDALLGPAPSRPEDACPDRASQEIAYRAQLPLGSGIQVNPAAETWDCELCGPKGVARVLPLALPEWRCGRPVGELRPVARGLELRQAARGQNLSATLFVDLQPQRRRRALTWRQLAVGENLQRVADDVAVGYRVQIGAEQWLFYRALANKGNRTLLGSNTAAEMLAARFHDGKAETLLQVEGFEGDE